MSTTTVAPKTATAKAREAGAVGSRIGRLVRRARRRLGSLSGPELQRLVAERFHDWYLLPADQFAAKHPDVPKDDGALTYLLVLATIAKTARGDGSVPPYWPSPSDAWGRSGETTILRTERIIVPRDIALGLQPGKPSPARGRRSGRHST
jgi:hypothetical protein